MFEKHEFVEFLKLNKIEKSLYFAILLVALTMPLNLILSRISLILVAVLWIVSLFVTKISSSNSTPKSRWYLLSLSLLYFMYCVGMFYSANFNFGFFDLEIKSSLILFPLFFATTGSNIVSKKFVKHIFASFIIGLLINTLVLVILAFIRFSVSHSISEFYYTVFSNQYHPSYLAIYIVFAFSIILNSLFTFRNNKLVTLLLIFLIAWFVIILVLLSSKAGFISFLVALFLLGFNKNALQKRNKKAVNISMLFLILFFVACLKLFPNLSNRINLAEKSVNSIENANNTEPEGSQVRLEVWKSSLELISINPLFGYGTGDVKDELSKKYSQRSFNYGVNQKMNSHNQYLQTTISIGIIGFLLLVYLLLFPLLIAFKSRNIIFIILVSVIALNLLFESMLERQFGVVFSSFFISLLLSQELFNKTHLEEK